MEDNEVVCAIIKDAVPEGMYVVTTSQLNFIWGKPIQRRQEDRGVHE
jgi:hypothetical protein